MSERFDVRGYVESNLERAKPSAGDEWTAACPECEAYGGFYVNTKTGSFICFKCEFRGRSVVYLVARVSGLTTGEARAWIFRQSVRLRRRETMLTLRERIAAIRPHRETADDDEAPGPVDCPLPRQFRPVWKKDRWDLPVYLKARRIRSATAKAWGLGYCRTGKYAGRLVIPIRCPGGSSFTARDMTGEQEPRYLNPEGADHRRLLIGWEHAKRTGDIAIVEGPLDAVKLWQHGISALALGGKEIHGDQLAQLATLDQESAVTIMLDPEEHTAPYKVAERLAVYFSHIYIARLPDGVDPGSSTLVQANTALDGARPWTRMGRTTAHLAKSRAALRSLDR